MIALPPQPSGVHLVGSVPLENSRTVFEVAHSILGKHLRRMPDGETGDRSNWIRWQFPVLANTSQLEMVSLPPDSYGNVLTQVKVRERNIPTRPHDHWQ